MKMKRNLSKVLLATVITIVGSYSYAIPQNTIQKNNPRVIQPNFSNGVYASDLVNIDFRMIKQELLNFESQLHEYPEANQVYFWFHLALTNHALRLPSDEVLPYFQKAISLISFVSDEEKFKILFEAHKVATTYEYYDLAISHLDQIKSLYPANYFENFSIDMAKLDEAYGRVYFASRDFEIAEQYYSKVVTESESFGFEPEENWLYFLSLSQLSIQKYSNATETLRKLYKLYPSIKNEVALRRHLGDKRR